MWGWYGFAPTPYPHWWVSTRSRYPPAEPPDTKRHPLTWETRSSFAVKECAAETETETKETVKKERDKVKGLGECDVPIYANRAAMGVLCLCVNKLMLGDGAPQAVEGRVCVAPWAAHRYCSPPEVERRDPPLPPGSR